MERRHEDNVLLDVRGLSKHFGGIKAVDEVTFAFEKRSIISMIGPNGAGKSTFINVVSGIYAPDAGKVHFQGEDITGAPAHEIAAKGIGRTFQFEELFGSLSVLENVMVGCHTGSRSDVLACGFSLPLARSEEKRVRGEAVGGCPSPAPWGWGSTGPRAGRRSRMEMVPVFRRPAMKRRD